MSRYARWLIACALLLTPHLAAAQQNATLQGAVLDESKAVMPGVTVTLTETSTGQQAVAVVGADGRYRFDTVTPGTYKLELELSGFATAQIPSIDVLVGANVTVPPVTMKVAALAETVMVSQQTPIVDVVSSQVSQNIDRRQMAELPLQGRNWMELSLMVKGVTANNIGNTPGVGDDQYQLNLDGQQITQRVAGSGFGEPKLSREAIAEFQVLTNQYDITQGRSTGIQVQAVSRAGTNQTQGSTYGFFRSDKFNAADPVKGTVLPYSDQQAGFTLGGPVVRDKLHYFTSYEYERNPTTAVLTPTVLPAEAWQFGSNTVQKNYLVRGDYQQSPSDSYSVRMQRWETANPFSITSGSRHPTAAESASAYSTNLYGTWTHIVSSNLITQAHFGIDHYSWYDDPIPAMTQQVNSWPFGVPVFQFPNLTLGGQQNYPNYTQQKQYQMRLDVNWRVGKHELKIGGEYLADRDTKVWDLNRRGTFVFNKTPSAALLQSVFPQADWDNAAAWNVNLLLPYVQEYDVFFHNDFLVNVPRPQTAAWIGDNWRVNDSLTLNLGLRYDLDLDGLNPPGVHDVPIPIDNGKDTGDFGYKTGTKDLNDFAPRAGFAWNVGGKGSLVIRGGSGLYYNFPVSNVT
ncbi:MAG TPA: TonB-dependent receptor, partial [Vicinamibacterales bacterium]|nr:TonB-dependent receptor [Vicinamibacterales bacterium]